MTTNSPNPVDGDVQALDYFGSLVNQARARAEKAMTKFPQPNYVLNKVAEESGEVIKAVIHYTEGRETWANVEAELIDNLAMLIRLVKEGDQVIGFVPPSEVQRLNATAQPVSDGWVKCSERMPDEENYYLTYSNAGVDVTYFDGEIFSDKYAFHWMPLPAAPGGQCD